MLNSLLKQKTHFPGSGAESLLTGDEWFVGRPLIFRTGNPDTVYGEEVPDISGPKFCCFLQICVRAGAN